MSHPAIDPLDSTAPPAAGGTGRSGLLVGLKLVVSLALLALVAAASDLAVLGALLARLQPGPALLAVVLLLGIATISGLRWWIVGRAIAAPLPLGACLSLMFIGTFFTQVLPTSVGGDAVRILLAGRRGLPYGRAFSGVVLERASGLLALVVMVAGGALWLGARLDPPVLRYFLLASLPGLLAALGLLCLLDRLPLPARLAGPARPLRALAADARRVMLAPLASLTLLLLSAAAHLCTAGAVWLLALGLGLPLGWWDSLALVPAIVLITFFPLSFAGWGVREGAAVVLLGFAGLAADEALPQQAAGQAADEALAVSVLLGLGLLAAGLPGCLLWLRTRRA